MLYILECMYMEWCFGQMVLVSKKSVGTKESKRVRNDQSGRKLLLRQDKIVWPHEENTNALLILCKSRKPSVFLLG